MAKSRSRRYEIARIKTTRNDDPDQVVWKWHVTQFQGKHGAVSWGSIDPDPGPDVADEQLARRAGNHGVHDVTVPVIIRRETSKERLGRILESLVRQLWGNQFATLKGKLPELPKNVSDIEIDSTLSYEVVAAIRWHRYYVEHMLPNLS